jgi:two-component system sensor histidine kinase RpfC
MANRSDNAADPGPAIVPPPVGLTPPTPRRRVPVSGEFALNWLASRFRNRPDTEHEQAFVRVAMATAMALYLAVTGATGLVPADVFPGVQYAIFTEIVVTVVLLAAIAIRPGVSHPRRIFGMLADYGTSGVVMYLQGGVAAPLYLVFLWVTIANGLRFGVRYLYLGIALASGGFSLIVWHTPFWRDNPILSATLIITLIAIPMYQRRLITDLMRAKDEAYRASKAKSWFLASMSHELRTPLNGIIGMVDLFSTTRMTPEQRQFADVIHASARTLASLVEDILDISAIEAGKIRIVTRDFSLGELLTSVGLMLKPSADAKHVAFDIEIDADVPDRLHGDADHLRQIVVNLVHNGIKFTERGGVAVRVHRLREDEHQVALQFVVADTGVGIPDAAKSRVFQAFEQANAGRDRKFGGSGLGTTIAKNLAERLGGEITFTSMEGKGTTFRFEAPFRRGDADTPSSAPAPGEVSGAALADRFALHRERARSLRVLVADDQEANRVMLDRILQKAGHRTVLVANGTDALDYLVDGDFDLAIVDLHMPLVTGIDVIQQAQTMSAVTRAIPIVVLSADATREAVTSAIDAGAYGFLTKPLSTARLLDLLDAVAANRARPDAQEAIEARMSEAEAADAADAEDQTLDPNVMRELREVSDDMGFVNDYARDCLRDARRCLDQAIVAGQREQWHQIREHCHALKGVAGNVGGVRLARYASEVMSIAPTQLPSLWAQYVRDLRRELEALERAMPGALAILNAEIGVL